MARTSSQKNATGYAKRQARKKKPDSDVYEYIPEHSKRSKVSLQLDRDETIDLSDGEDQLPKVRLIGELEDDDKIDSGDDEEIDSDAAFEESDEEQFAGFFSAKQRQKPKKPKVRFADVDLNEDEEMDEVGENADSDEEEEGDDDEFIDVLDIMDGRGEPDNDTDTEMRQQEEEDDSDEDDLGEESDASNPLLPSDDDEDGPEALDDLEKFIHGLDPTAQKRKLPATESTSNQRPAKRRMLKEATAAGPENEFGVSLSSSKLTLDDLLMPLSNESSLKKSVATLASTSKARTLSAPLPQRTQDRLDRQAAYEQTKEEVDKWKGTMERIRDAEHLSFPLQASPAGRVSNLELAAKFKPTTELESAVDSLLKAAKLRDEDIEQTEDSMLKSNDLTVEEVAERRAELRKMRELMFRAEIKAKRVAKIKSKTYRKLRRKEKEKLDKAAEDDDDGPEAQLKHELDRARERATLRHKNTGKWAKQMKGRENWDDEGRKGIEEMLERGDKLRRKIAGKDSDDEDESSEESDPDDTSEDVKSQALQALNRLQDNSELDSHASKVFQMKFMKDAMARQQSEADRQVDDFMMELAGESTSGPIGDDEASANAPSVSRYGGRIVYRPGPQATSGVSPVPASSENGPVESEAPAQTVRSPSPPPSGGNGALAQKASIGNPWLDHSQSDSVAQRRKKNEVVIGKDSKAAEKSQSKAKKLGRKTENEKAKAKEDSTLEISLDSTLASSEKTKNTKPVENDSDPDINSEVEEQEALLSSKGKGTTSFQQRELVALAFAGDNVTKEFEEVKKREIQADAPKEVDVTIPGWGSWGGSGAKARPESKRFIKKFAGIDPKSRADFKKSHVIISEKVDKKASKYLVKDLPYPYTSKAQFDRRMEQPLGTEWNTRTGFQRATLPKVTKKMGTVIDPLQKLF